MAKSFFQGLAMAIGLGLGFGLGAGAAGAGPGVILETVDPNGEADQAGLRPGDRLLRWELALPSSAEAEPVSGEIRTPFDLFELETEQAPRGRVRLAGTRPEGAWSASMPPGSWHLSVRPNLPKDQLLLQDQAVVAAEAGRLEEALELGRRLESLAREGGEPIVACWIPLELARRLPPEADVHRVQAAWEEQLRTNPACGPASVAAPVWRELGWAWERQSRFEEAEACYEEAGRLWESAAPESLALARLLSDRGNVASAQGRLEPARGFYQKALELREKRAPGSLLVASSLNDLGQEAAARGEQGRAESLYRPALELAARLAPGSLTVLALQNNLGLLLHEEGRLAEAEALFQDAARLEQAREPGSAQAAYILNNLASLALDRGDLAAAAEAYQKTRELLEALAPDSLDGADVISNLGLVAWKQGDLEKAGRLFLQALEARRRLAPESQELGAILLNLGAVAWARGDRSEAEARYRQAYAIEQKIAPDSLSSATMLANLAEVLFARGSAQEAEALLRSSLALRSRLAPGSLDEASGLHALGALALERGELEEAGGLYGRALEIRERLAPGSAEEAATLEALGRLAARQGDRPLAARRLQEAVDALDSQLGRLGGSEEVRSGFVARQADLYRECVDAWLEVGDTPKAFQVLERSRARVLLSMLAERDLTLEQDLPPELRQSRQRIAADYDATQAQIAKLGPAGEGDRLQALLGHLAELRERQERLRESIRALSPRLASLRYPQPLSLAEAEAVLDPGTVLLEYEVGAKTTHLFVLRGGASAGADGLRVYTIGLGEAALRGKVVALRGLIQNGSSLRAAETAFLSRSQELYRMLVAPAEEELRGADRVLISPDGPLRLLPFGALVQKAGEARPSYLAEAKPLHFVLSTTLYAELRRARSPAVPRGPAAGPELVAFGDPDYSAASGEGWSLAPLPGTRAEVEAMAALYGGAARAFLGKDATEARARSEGASARYLHFACHGLTSASRPLDSSLVLSLPQAGEAGADNGFLQAWEIFEHLRLKADLVTLSACETGLGQEMGGEGLIGLSRAFQYAGARTVLASLWSVPDRSTAELMRRFYGHLREGLSKDEALRAAELELLEGEFPEPVHWAAFQLLGDWQ